jgi:hypothetical protein
VLDCAQHLYWQMQVAGIAAGWEREQALIPKRRFRCDLANVALKATIECDGGVWVAGRHSRGAGVTQDCEKTCLLAILGYVQLRVTAQQIQSGVALKWVEAFIKARASVAQAPAGA